MINVKHFNPKKKLVLSGVSALFTCSGAPPTSFFLGLKMFRLYALMKETANTTSVTLSIKQLQQSQKSGFLQDSFFLYEKKSYSISKL